MLWEVQKKSVLQYSDAAAEWVQSAINEVERLKGDNKYFCERCLCLVEAERSMHFLTTAPILTIHLKRFAATSGYVTLSWLHLDLCMFLTAELQKNTFNFGFFSSEIIIMIYNIYIIMIIYII